MEAYEQLSDRGVEVDRRVDSETVEVIADFGPAADIAVDVVDETVIVVTDGEAVDIEVEDEAQAFIKNGVLTIEQPNEVDS